MRGTLRTVPANGACPLFPIGISYVALLVTVLVIPASTRAGEAQRRADFHVRWAEQAFAKGPQPFSFSYGGRRSADVLGKWKRKERLQADDAAVGSPHHNLHRSGNGPGSARGSRNLPRHAQRRMDPLFHKPRQTEHARSGTGRCVDVTVPLSVSNDVKFHRLMGSLPD